MNQAIFDFLFSFTHRIAWLDTLTVFIAREFTWWWVVVLVIIAIISIRSRPDWGAVTFSTGAAMITWVLSELIKLLLAANRPFVTLPSGSTLLTYGSGADAFPSSHAAFLFSVAIAIYFYNRTLGNISLVVAILVSLARVATGLHWPIDIVGGFFLALIVVLILDRFYHHRTISRPFV